jgi:outer membrane phospholipase A
MKLLVLLGLISAASLRAEPLVAPQGGDPFERARQGSPVQAFQANYGAVAMDHDEIRVQYQISLQYGLIPLESLEWSLAGYRLQALDVAYEGLFDFYLWNRPSQPLISRRQNPGVYFDLRPRADGRWAHLDSLQAGWFHESNGQVIDSLPQWLAAGRHAQDYVSRAWDYWYLAAPFGFQPSANLRLHLSPSLRIFTGAQGVLLPAEEDIFWRPNEAPSYISDYDGLRLELGVQRLFPGRVLGYVELTGSLRTGYNPGHFAAHWSGRATLTVKTWHLPWMLYYDSGYGEYISDYSAWGQGWGLGLRFWG